MSRSKTVTEEFDTEGHLLKRTIEEWSDEAEPAKSPMLPPNWATGGIYTPPEGHQYLIN